MSFIKSMVFLTAFILASCSTVIEKKRTPSSLKDLGSCQKILKRILSKKSYYISHAEDISSWKEFNYLAKKVNRKIVKDPKFKEALFNSPYLKDAILDEEGKQELIDGLAKYVDPNQSSYSLYDYLVNKTYKAFSLRELKEANTLDDFFKSVENMISNNHQIMYHEWPPKLSEVDALPQRDYFDLGEHQLISRFNEIYTELGKPQLTSEQQHVLKLLAHHSIEKQNFKWNIHPLIELFKSVEGLTPDLSIATDIKFLEAKSYFTKADLEEVLKKLISMDRGDKNYVDIFQDDVIEALKVKAKGIETELEAINFMREISQYFPPSETTLEKYVGILRELPFIKNLSDREIPSHVLTRFTKALSEKKNSSLYFAEYFEKLVERLLLQEVKEVSTLAKKTNSTLAFLDLVQRMSVEELLEDEKLISEFLSSPWGKNTGLSLDEAKALFLKIKSQGLEDRQGIVNAVKEEYPSFKIKEENLLNFSRADKEVSTVGVKDQCQWGACWAYAGSEGVEIRVSKSAGVEIPLSTEHLYLQYVITKSQEVLEFDLNIGDLLKEFPDGGTSTKLMGLVQSYGMIPTDALPRALSSFPRKRDALLVKVQGLIEQAQAGFRGLSGEELNAAKVIEQDRLRKEIEAFFGEIPKEFDFKGETYTAKSFMKKFYPGIEEDYSAVTLKSAVEEFQKAKKKFKPSEEEWFREQRFRDIDGKWVEREVTGLNEEVEFSEYLKFLKDNIDNEQPLYLSYDLPKGTWSSNGAFRDKSEFVNEKTGEIFLPKGKIERSNKAGHAVLAVGYELNLKGEIEYVKILNSWGTNSGDRGFYYIHRDYLEAFANTLQPFK